METEITQKDTKRLEESVDRLTDEHKSYFLGILEGLFFAQNIKEASRFKAGHGAAMSIEHRGTVRDNAGSRFQKGVII
jgi:hypothetical protein